eukprot:CAMPEP_0172583114 /NCGR_PEP_ID=MMETSP1068-20121228/2709_1 /TAXON_ID=35684 /ORGANISM="Pseudopedinella elastica, Strain CCMP716" /LENGTH=123 /DNA_ID=CAMNT_0013376779 /DNA_START=201 /DNA_END=569 /DNA_ORIENTATION=-
MSISTPQFQGAHDICQPLHPTRNRTYPAHANTPPMPIPILPPIAHMEHTRTALLSPSSQSKVHSAEGGRAPLAGLLTRWGRLGVLRRWPRRGALIDLLPQMVPPRLLLAPRRCGAPPAALARP